MLSKKRYLNVNNKLGNAIMWNTGLDALTSANIGGLIVTDNNYIKIGLGLLGISCIVLRRLTQKFIDLNTPGKRKEDNLDLKKDVPTS